MTTRRVLMTVDAVGGVWRYACDTARGLHSLGIACLLVGFGPPPSRETMAACRNADLVWTDEPLDWMVADDAALQPGATELVRIVESWQPDLVHLNLPSQAVGISGSWPVVVTAHSCVPTWWQSVHGGVLPAHLEWQRRRNAQGFERADAVLVPSASYGNALLQVYGPMPHLRVVHNGTASLSSLGGQEPFVLAAGRWWDEAKNATCLDDAAAHSHWPVVMAGPLSGPSGETTALNYAKAAGQLAPAALRALMQRAAIFAAPSRYEPFGLAVLEAAMSGAALVLADIPTFRELWSDVAVFVPATDPRAWTIAINDLSAESDRRACLAAQAQQRAMLMTIECHAQRLAETYKDVLAQCAVSGAA